MQDLLTCVLFACSSLKHYFLRFKLEQANSPQVNKSCHILYNFLCISFRIVSKFDGLLSNYNLRYNLIYEFFNENTNLNTAVARICLFCMLQAHVFNPFYTININISSFSTKSKPSYYDCIYILISCTQRIDVSNLIC